jgi:uncharacterized protein YjdB
VGDTLKVTASPLDKKGNVVSPAPTFTYTSDNATSMSVSPDLGFAVSLLPKPDTVRVRIAGRQTVAPNEFIAIELLQKTANISFPLLVGGQVLMTAPNQDTTLTAIASDSRNVDIQLANDKFTWTSSVQRVAQVASDGKISARDTGTTVISASRDGKTVGFPVIVTNIPTTLAITPDPMAIRSLTESVQATPVARNIATGIVPNAVVNWTSLDPTIATVNASGLVTGVAVGAARVVGVTQVGGAVDTITVNVSNQAASIVLGLSSATMASIGDTLLVPITAKNSLGATLPATGVRWRSDATDVAKVSIANDGTIVALKRGEARIIAENADGSVADTVPVTVTNAPASVVVNRTNDNLTALNLTLQYNATIMNARGGVIAQGGGSDQSPLSWRSTDPTVATVDVNGLATAVGNGATLIIAETGSGTFATGLRADTATLTVSNNAVAAAVNPTSVSITSVGGTQQLTASATNNVGGPVTGLTFTWTTSDGSVASVSSSGLVTATGIGTATITATAGSLQATSTITVTNLPTFIDITLGNITLASVNDFTTLAATLKNALGAVLPNTAASWTSDDPLIALVTSDGTVTAKAAGTTKIRATNPGNAAVKDSITVTVSNAAASVTLSPGTTQTLASIGQTLNLSTTVLNQAGQPILNPSVTWDLVSGTSVSVATSGVGTGLVTALTNGTSTVRATSGSVSATVDVIVAQAISPSQSTVSASPSTLTANAVDTSVVTVQLKDANGNDYVRSPAASVVMTPSSGIPVTMADSGNGRFVAIHPAQSTAGTSTVNVKANGISLSNPVTLTFTPDAATHYAVTASNTAPVAGTAITLSAQLKDANGNNVAIAGRTISWSSSNGGTFGPSSPTNASGLATVTFTTANTTRSYSITALDNTSISGTTSASITSIAGAAAKYLVSSSAASVVAGGSTTITAQLVDANNNTVGAAGETVTWSGGAGGSFGSATSTTTGSGTATVTFTPSTAAGTTVTVTGTDGAARTGTSGTITTVAGPAAVLTLTASPEATPQSGIAFTSQPVIQLRDGSASQNPVALANVPVTATISSGTGTLGGITTVLTNSSGVATFTNLSISGTSSANTISFISSGVAPASAAVTIVAGAAQNIVANSATSQTVTAGGSATAPSVIVRDAANNPRGGVAVTFTVTAGAGTTNPASGNTVLSDPVTGVAALSSWTTGVAAGTNTVTAAVAGLAGSPVTFTATGVAGVTTAPQSTVVRTGADNIVADGISTSTIVVTAKDANGNPVAGKTISLDDGAASSTISTSSSTSDTNGQVVFTVTNNVGETATYTATITDGAAIVVTQTAQVTFRAGTNYLVSSTSTTPVAGSTVIITAQLRDGANQNVPQAGKTIVWSKLCNAGACAGTAAGGSFATPTSLTDATGKATVALTVSTDASIGMTVTATDNAALTGTSTTLDVVPAAAAAIRVETAADGTGSVVGAQSIASGSSLTAFSITRDQFGNFVANAPGTWTLTNKTGGVADADLVAAGDNKSAVFTAVLTGSANISATSGGLTATPSGLITVTSGSADHITLSGPASVVAGAASTNFTLTVFDAAGNVTNVAGNTTFDLTTSVSQGTSTFNPASPVQVNAGTSSVTFTYSNTVVGSGTHQITATRNAGDALAGGGAASHDITVDPDVLNNFLVEAAGGGAIATQTAGSPFNLRITARDQFNNTQTNFTGTVDLTSTSTVSGAPLTSVAFTAGVLASQAITLETAGSHTITATNSGSTETGTSNSFTVNAAALDHFVLATSSPQTTALAFAGANTLTAVDQFGNTVTTFDASTDAVTIGLANASTGSLTNNVLNLAGDFVNGVADLTAKGLTYTRSAAEASIDLQASSATTIKVSNIVTVAINP